MVRILLLISLLFVPTLAWAETPLEEADRAFMYKGEPIHPGLIMAFQNWLSDYRPPITVTLDVGAAFDTNQYNENVTRNRNGDPQIQLSEGGTFAYRHLGRLDNGVHVLLTFDWGGGSGVFLTLTFVRFHMHTGYDRDGLKPSERLLMSVVRHYGLGAKKVPDITVGALSVSFENAGESVTLDFKPSQGPILKPGHAAIANPASVNCIEQNGTLELITTDKGEHSLCHLPDGTICEEWKLFRGECP